MRFAFIRAEDEQKTFPVEPMCRVLSVSTSGYYAWLKRKPTKRSARKAELTEMVKAVHEASRGTYGSPRVTEKLKQTGETVSENTVAKIMKENDIAARKKRRFKATTDSKHTKRIADNLLQRDFTVSAPNKVWVTDVTAVWTLAGWVYLAALVDLFSRRVVGWAMSDSNDTTLALAALDRALRLRKPPAGLIHHSDRGSPYGSDDYITRLDAAGIVRSMSRKGDCWDNAVAESLFSTLEFECRGRHAFADLADAQRVIGAFLDGFYNTERMHSTIDYRSPIEYEVMSTLSSQAA
jgi:transposase InsO family protein